MERAFINRTEAGRLLAEKLGNYANRNDVVVLGLPRGGVPVAYEVAKRLNAPLDVFIVRKLGVPGFRRTGCWRDRLRRCPRFERRCCARNTIRKRGD